MAHIILLVYGVLHLATLVAGYFAHKHHTDRHNKNEDIMHEIIHDIQEIKTALKN